jgi:hypothetical protein
MTTRRGFIGGMAALFCAPAIVRAGSLMPVRALPAEDFFDSVVAPSVVELVEGVQSGILMTPAFITIETLRILHNNLILAKCHDTLKREGFSLHIRHPETFQVRRDA